MHKPAWQRKEGASGSCALWKHGDSKPTHTNKSFLWLANSVEIFSTMIYAHTLFRFSTALKLLKRYIWMLKFWEDAGPTIILWKQQMARKSI